VVLPATLPPSSPPLKTSMATVHAIAISSHHSPFKPAVMNLHHVRILRSFMTFQPVFLLVPPTKKDLQTHLFSHVLPTAAVPYELGSTSHLQPQIHSLPLFLLWSSRIPFPRLLAFCYSLLGQIPRHHRLRPFTAANSIPPSPSAPLSSSSASKATSSPPATSPVTVYL
jgi:hypothetical protein